MWFKVYADGTQIDIVFADNPQEAVNIVKMRLIDTCFDGVRWGYKYL